ncbi:hypothetical protein FNJ82_02770 [Escherichia coli]|nr:hypothetical protein AWG86_008705 [Escherichia coli]TRO92144.1 hypothetical protein FNJ82_02770 [Escherichia coli]
MALGDAKRNDGILIIVAWSDRTVRIQVGYGLEEKGNRCSGWRYHP